MNENDSTNASNETKINIKTFENTSSTRLELQTLLWALSELLDTGKKIVVYTDSQNIIRLPDRRVSLQENDYKSKKYRALSNHNLYREFYKLTDQIQCEFVKVKGHKPDKNKGHIDRIFTLVDRAARKGIRKLNS